MQRGDLGPLSRLTLLEAEDAQLAIHLEARLTHVAEIVNSFEPEEVTRPVFADALSPQAGRHVRAVDDGQYGVAVEDALRGVATPLDHLGEQVQSDDGGHAGQPFCERDLAPH